MTTTPGETPPDPEVVPSGDPTPIPTAPIPASPGEEPDAPQPEVAPPTDPQP